MINDELRQYIQECLNDTDSLPDWYDPDGNSSRAIISRIWGKGFWSEVLKEIPESWEAFKGFYCDFEGIDTPIGWFLAAIVLPFLLPVMPVLRTLSVYRRAIKDYQKEFDAKHKSKGEK